MLEIGVAEFKRFARKRKITYADKLCLTDSRIVIFDSSSMLWLSPEIHNIWNVNAGS